MSSNDVEDSVAADAAGEGDDSVSGSVDDLDGKVIPAVVFLSVSYVSLGVENVDDGRSCWSQNSPL